MGFRSRKKAGVIGLGIIGSRVAENLRRAKFQTCVWNRTPRPAPNFLASPGAVAETCEILQIFVADPAALHSVLEMLRPKLKPHHLVLNHATVSPEATSAAAEFVHSAGATFLDAPFTGSKDAAANAQIVYYIGGAADAMERARPVLEASGRRIIHIGGIGDATLMKLAMNVMIAMQAQAMVEALALTTANGLDPATFAEVLKENAARSGVSDMKLPRILVGDYETHFSVKHMLKDVQFGMKAAEDCGLHLPATQVAGGALLQAMTEGHGDLDFSAIAKNFPFLIAKEPETGTIPEPDAATPPAEENPVENKTQPGPLIDSDSVQEEDADAANPENPVTAPPHGALIAYTPADPDPAPPAPAAAKPSALPVIERPHLPEPSAPHLKLPAMEELPALPESTPESVPEPATGPIHISELAEDEERLVISPPEPAIAKKVSIRGRPGLFRARNED